MANKILIPTPLRPFTGKQDAVEVDGATVGELLVNLTTRYAGLKPHLYNEQGKLRSFVNVYLNDEDIRYLEKEKTAVKPGDTVSIIPSVAGGAQTGVAEEAKLTNDEVQRYSRHLIMPEVGVEGQLKLKAGSVLCIGAGGLGSPAALYLAAAGVGRIGIVDFDVVDYSNLQRQVIHSTRDVGRSKLASAKDRLLGLNPHITIDTYETALSSKNALDLFKPYDVILDGTDNFPTRYLVNDACVILDKPNAYGSIFRFEGQASVFATRNGPCYRCLYPEPPPPGLVPSCAEGGVLGVLPGVIGTIQATEAVKLIMGIGEPLIGRFLVYDALRMKFRELKLKKDPDCPVCGTHPTITELIDYEQFCGIAPASEPAATANEGSMTNLRNETETDVVELKRKMDAKEDFFLLDVREPNEYQIGKIPGSTLIPLGEVPRRYQEIPRDKEIIVHCKMGGRSAKAAEFLRQQGFKNVKNLKGGILDWSDKIDPSVPKY
jgi:sulfur-carrier protein adenylyltransferase/sulfurtransferase